MPFAARRSTCASRFESPSIPEPSGCAPGASADARCAIGASTPTTTPASSVLARRRLTDHDDPYASLPQPADGRDGARDPGVDRDGVRLLRAPLGLVGAGRDADEHERGVAPERRRDALGSQGLAVRDDDGRGRSRELPRSDRDPRLARRSGPTDGLRQLARADRRRRASPSPGGAGEGRPDPDAAARRPRSPDARWASAPRRRRSSSSWHFSPGRAPITCTSMSRPGTRPESRIRLFARSRMFTGSPISSVKTSPPCARALACSTSWTASSTLMK